MLVPYYQMIKKKKDDHLEVFGNLGTTKEEWEGQFPTTAELDRLLNEGKK